MGETKLVITIDRNGVARVEGPLTNRLLCYGMLEEAREIIRTYDATKTPRVLPVTAVPTNGRG